ncbi:MAG: hypothetical protein ACK5TO_23235, partial [Planctomycetaceae bacterium]
YQKVRRAAAECGRDKLRPIHEKLQEQVDFPLIRLALTRLDLEEPLEAAPETPSAPTTALTRA